MTLGAIAEDADQERLSTPIEPLKHNLQVAFAGHNRAEDLGDAALIFEQLRSAFALLRNSGVSDARLLTGLASGADVIAAKAWREAALGPVHAVLPYLDFETNVGIGPGGLADSATWLDGTTAETSGRNAHLKQTRMIVEAADLVVVVWTGEPARGAGGTADAVQEALQLGLPVLWLRPSEPRNLRIIRPEQLPADFHFPEFQEGLDHGSLRHVQEATPERLRDALANAAFRPLPDHAHVSPLRERFDELMHGTVWKTYRTLRDLLGGKVHLDAPDDQPPPSLAEQPGFQVLSQAYTRADHLANRLAAIHRSEQVLLILAMILCAVVGSLWMIWPGIKVTAVAVELILPLIGLLVWAFATGAQQNERWGEFRLLAERLRLERASWAVGIGMARRADRARGDLGAWRQVRRDAGLPIGPFDPERSKTWGAWALTEIVRGQAAYHRAVSIRDARFAHSLQRFERLSFAVFFVIFTFFLATHLSGHGHDLPHWFPGVVAMTGTVVPALGAAILALEAKLEPEEQSHRSERLADSLDDLQQRLAQDPSLEGMQKIVREAVALHVSESGYWEEGIARRRLFRA